MKQNRTSPDLFQVGEKRSTKRGGSPGEYRMQDPGEELAATPVGLWQFPWRKMGVLNCFPKVIGFSVLVANAIISITQSLAREIPNPQEVAGPLPSGFVDDRQIPALR